MVRVAAEDGDLCQTLRDLGYTAFEVPAIVLINRPFYEVFIASHKLEQLRHEYPVEVNYDPLRVKDDLAEQMGGDGAKVYVRSAFLTRLVAQPEPVRRLYILCLEAIRPVETRHLVDLLAYGNWGTKALN